MSAAFLKLIPAAPGWRVASAWYTGDGEQWELGYEPVVAWAEVEDRPGELVPVGRDGWCEAGLYRLDEDDTFLAILAPGDNIDPADESWKCNIKCALKRQADRA